MNIELAKNFMEVTSKYSPDCFLNPRFEMIVEPKNNIYFGMEDVETELELKCRVLAWLSRPSCKGVSKAWQKKIRNIVNEYLETDFSEDDMHEIYTWLGNDINRNLTVQFIESNYDFSVLNKEDK